MTGCGGPRARLPGRQIPGLRILEAEAHLQIDGADGRLVAIEKLSRKRKGLVEVLAADHVAWLRQVHYVEDVVRRNCEVEVVSASHRVGMRTAEETTTTAA